MDDELMTRLAAAALNHRYVAKSNINITQVLVVGM